MKLFCILVLTLTLCLGSCDRQSATPIDFVTTKQQLSAAFEEREGFSRADEDFVATNFGAPDYLLDSAVYLANNGEIGVFSLSDAKHAADMQEKIKAYLSTEREAVISLAELYPAEELSARLARFDGARVGAVGATVYYYMLDANVSAVAKKLFQK